MGIGEYIWRILGLSLTTPWGISEIISGVVAIVLGIIVWKHPNWEDKVKNLFWMIPVGVLIIVTPLAWATSSYDLYQEKQEEMNDILTDKQAQITELQNKIAVVQEDHRPILTFDPSISLNPEIDETNHIAKMNIKIVVDNIGDRPAYQTFSTMSIAPLDEPENMIRRDNGYEVNPIYKGTRNSVIVEHTGHYTVRGNTGTIIIRLFIKYNDAPIDSSGGKWYQDVYWYSFNIDLVNKTTVLNAVNPEVIQYYEPYVTKLYQP